MIKGIGVNIDTRRVNGSIRRFTEELYFFQKLGFDYVEIPPAALDVIVRGRIIQSRLERIKGLLENFYFKYTIHAPDVLNLKEKSNPWHYKVMESTILFAKEINAESIVYHLGTVNHSLDLTEKEQKNSEIKSLRSLAKLAENYDIKIGIENTSQPVDEILETVKRIDHPSVGLTLDIGHLFIFCEYTGVDFYDQIEKGLKKAVEIHVSDNFGESTNTYKSIPNIEFFQFIYGVGDLHLPIGQGDIPYHRILKMIRESTFDGVVTLEINSMDRFEDDYKDSLEILRNRLIKRQNGVKNGKSQRRNRNV